MSDPTYHAPVDYRSAGMRLRGMAKFTRDCDGQIDLDSVQLTHLQEQPIAHGMTVVICASEMPHEDFDEVREQVEAQFPSDDEDDGYDEDMEYARPTAEEWCSANADVYR
jgi:hypothetical protein